MSPRTSPSVVVAAAALSRLLAVPWPEARPVGPVGPGRRLAASASRRGRPGRRVRWGAGVGRVRRVGDGLRGPLVAPGSITTWDVELDGDQLGLRSADEQLRFAIARAATAVWVGRDGRAWELSRSRAGAGRRTRGPEPPAVGSILSPMPGTVTAVLARSATGRRRTTRRRGRGHEDGAHADRAGGRRLASLSVAVGDKVARRQVLAVVEPATADPPASAARVLRKCG